MHSLNRQLNRQQLSANLTMTQHALETMGQHDIYCLLLVLVLSLAQKHIKTVQRALDEVLCIIISCCPFLLVKFILLSLASLADCISIRPALFLQVGNMLLRSMTKSMLYDYLAEKGGGHLLSTTYVSLAAHPHCDLLGCPLSAFGNAADAWYLEARHFFVGNSFNLQTWQQRLASRRCHLAFSCGMQALDKR